MGFVLAALILMFGVVRPGQNRRKKEMQASLDLLEAEGWSALPCRKNRVICHPEQIRGPARTGKATQCRGQHY